MHRIINSINKRIKEYTKDNLTNEMNINDYNLNTKINIDNYKIKEYYINNYSEISHLIAKQKQKEDIVIPIKPIKLLKDFKANILYNIIKPTFSHAKDYLHKLNINIKSLLVKKNQEDNYIVHCLYLSNNTYLSIIDIHYTLLNNINEGGDYNIIYSECDPIDIDTSLYSVSQNKEQETPNGLKQKNMDDYIISYNKNKSHENLLFNHILDLINNKYIIVDGININHKFIQGEYIFFKKIIKK